MKVLVSLAGLGRLLGVKVETVALPAGSGWGDADDGERTALIVYCDEGPGVGREAPAPAFKVGDLVTWTSQAAGTWKEKSGDVAYVIPRGAYLDGVVDRDICIAAGLPTLGRRKHVSYVVRVGSKLYWPRVASLRAVAAGTDPDPEEAISRARRGVASAEDADVIADGLVRLRALMVDRNTTCAACKAALVAMCPECSLIPSESRAP